MLAAIESIGIRCDGRLQALNSFENRVYLVGLDDGTSRVVKFYRPARWRNEQILEEHASRPNLPKRRYPWSRPRCSATDSTLAQAGGFSFAVYPRQGGRSPDLDNAFHGPAMRDRIGQFIARIHNVGARAPFRDRPEIGPRTYGHEPIAIIRESGMLPPELASSWLAIAAQCVQRVEERFDRCGNPADAAAAR